MARPIYYPTEGYCLPSYLERPEYLAAHQQQQQQQAAMYMTGQTSDQNYQKSTSWQQRRPTNLTLHKPAATWAYPSTYDALPTPPMSNSPTSSRRLSRLSETTGSFVDETTSAPCSTVPSSGVHMTAQVLPPPPPPPPPPSHIPLTTSTSSHPFYQQPTYPPPPTIYDPRLDPQPRTQPYGTPLTAQHYASVYQTSNPFPYAHPYPPPHETVQLGSNAYQGPTSAAGPASASRVPKTSRRAKAHVAKACQHCKKAHLSCDEARPCTRCVANGKDATCVDVEHKKRGRPRLRDTRDADGGRSNVAASFASSVGSASGLHSRGNSLDLSALGGLARASSLRQPLTSSRSHAASISSERRPGAVTDVYYPSRMEASTGPSHLIAYLSLDLRVLRTNEAFSNVFLGGGDPRGRQLSDFVDQRFAGEVSALQVALREEKTSREPNYLPSIFSDHEDRAVEQVNDHEIEAITQGFIERSNQWTYVLYNGQAETMYSRMRLAKTSAYFAVLVLRRIARPGNRRSMRPQSMDASSLSGAHALYLAGLAGSRSLVQGPQTPYDAPTPTSPFANMTSLGTTLPPPTHAIPATNYGPSSAPRQHFSGPSSHPQNPSLMSPTHFYQPPPPPIIEHQTFHQQPLASSHVATARPESARERRRPEPLGPLHLPPIVSSAPSTPREAGGVQLGPSPDQAQSSSGGPLQTPQRGSVETPGEDSSRKRRRMDIGDIVG